MGCLCDNKIIDCTIRDGGLVNNFKFDDAFVKAVYKACTEAGLDYMEIGYKASKKIFSPAEYGKWKFSDEEDIKGIIESFDHRTKLSVMVDAERTDYHEDILPKNRSVLDMVRVAAYSHQLPTAIDMVKDAHDKGYEAAINLMAVSLLKEEELERVLELLSATEAQIIYLVDSYGTFYPETIKELVRKYLGYVQSSGKKVGIHTHNNQQLAFANTIQAANAGAAYLDATISGLGRGAGNCPVELLLGYLKNPRYSVYPILTCIQDKILPLRKTVKWGYTLPYMFTGQLNLHPQYAIDMLKGADNSDYVSFYNSLLKDR